MNRWLVIAIFAGLAHAADTLYLSEQDVVAMATEQSPSVRSAALDVEKARAQLGQSRAGFMPQLSLSAGYTYLSYAPEMEMVVPNFDNYPQITLDTVLMHFGYNNNYQIKAQASQLLFSWGRVLNSYSMAKEGLTAAELSLKAKKTEAAAAARAAFWGALTGKQFLELSQQLVSNYESHYNDAKKRYNSGVASEFEVLTAEVKWRNAQPQVQDAEKAYRDALDGLKVLLNIPQETEVILKGDTAGPRVPDLDVDSLVVLALSNRPEIASLEHQLAGLRKLAAIQSAGDKPQLVGFGGYTYSKPYGMDDEWGGTWSAGISLNWNIFDGFLSRSKVSEAKAQAEQLELALSLQKEQVKNQVRAGYRALEDAMAKLSTAEQTVALAEKSLSLVKKQRANGVATDLQLYDAETNLFQARVNLLSSRMQMHSALAQLEKAVGVSLTQSSQEENNHENQ